MRAASSLLPFMLLGIAAAAVIPKLAVRDASAGFGQGGLDLVPGFQGGTPNTSDLLHALDIANDINPAGKFLKSLVRSPRLTFLAAFSTGGVEHARTTGKHSLEPSGRPTSTNVITSPGSSLGGFGHPTGKPTGKHSHPETSRGADPTATATSLGPSFEGSGHPTGKHPRPETSRGVDPTAVPASPGSSFGGSGHHGKPTGKYPHPETSRAASKTAGGDNGGSEHPKHTDKPSRPKGSHKMQGSRPTETERRHHHGGHSGRSDHRRAYH